MTADNKPASLDLGLLHGPPAPKRRRGRSFKRYYKPTGRRPGRPTNEEQAFRAKIDQESKQERRKRSSKSGQVVKFGPPVPKGLNWGGKRAGAGRPRRVGPSKNKITMIRMDRELAAELDSLPKGKKSEYIRAAIDLMKDLRPPRSFLP